MGCNGGCNGRRWDVMGDGVGGGGGSVLLFAVVAVTCWCVEHLKEETSRHIVWYSSRSLLPRTYLYRSNT